jgi:hypothetical protein
MNFTSNKGKTLAVGISSPKYQSESFVFTRREPLLAFIGSGGAKLFKIGGVTVLPFCAIGKDS